MTYIFISLFVSIVALTSYKKKWTGLFITILLLFLLMFRGDDVGHDTKAYIDPHYMFVRVNQSMDLSTDEINTSTYGRDIELISNKIFEWVYYSDLPPRFVLYFYAIITIVFLYFAFKRYRINIALGMMFYVLLGLFYFSMTAVRQMAAVSVVAFAISYIFDTDKKKYLFFLFILLATLIHASSLFFIWLYFLRSVKVSREMVITVSAVICVVFTLFPIDFMGIIYSITHMSYITSYKGQYDSTEKPIFASIIGLIILAYYYYWLLIKNKETKTDLYDNLFLLAVLLSSLFSSHSILLSRINFFVTIFMCVFLSKEMVEKRFNKNEEMKFVTCIFVLLKIYMSKDWNSMLDSNYYLMF